MKQQATGRARAVRHGFTLVELIVVVAVAAVLMTLAAPGVRDLILAQRLKSIHAQLLTDIQFARSEAVAQSRFVAVSFRPAGPGDAVACYVVYIDNDINPDGLAIPNRCNCTRPPGDMCNINVPGVFVRELRGVHIPRELGVSLSIPANQATRFAFNPITGGLLLPASEPGLPRGSEFIATSLIDSARQLNAIVGMAGRVRSCTPAGSTLNEVPCSQ